MWLFVLFVVVPIIEIALFIQVGGAIGLWPTLAIVIATAAAGTYLVRGQGVATLAELQRQMQDGRDPTVTLVHGVLILVAGLLLLTPGFFTDAMGLSLLVPAVRAALIRHGAARLAGKVQVFGMHSEARSYDSSHPEGDVIDADFEDLDDEDTSRPRGSSGWTRPR